MPYVNGINIIIALNGSAQSELKQKGVHYFKGMDFFKNDDHIKILEKSKELIELLRNEFYLSDLNGVTHAYEREFFNYFRNYYVHHWLMYLQIIHNAVNILKPTTVILPEIIKPTQIESVIAYPTSIIGYIGSEYAKSYGIEYKKYCVGGVDVKKHRNHD